MDVIYEVQVKHRDGAPYIAVDTYPIVRKTKDKYFVKVFDSFEQILKIKDDGVMSWTANAKKIHALKTKVLKEYVANTKKGIENIVKSTNKFIKECNNLGINTAGLKL